MYYIIYYFLYIKQIFLFFLKIKIMNLNEFFFFKVFRCQNNQKHNYEKCYFYHNEVDSKRSPLNFPSFLDKFEKFK